MANIIYAAPNIQPGDVVEDCNYSQLYPHTPLTDAAGVTFRRCNLFNCDLPADAVVEDCLHVHKDLCYWLWKDAGVPLDEEPVECRHVIGHEEDGTPVREDTLVE